MLRGRLASVESYDLAERSDRLLRSIQSATRTLSSPSQELHQCLRGKWNVREISTPERKFAFLIMDAKFAPLRRASPISRDGHRSVGGACGGARDGV